MKKLALVAALAAALAASSMAQDSVSNNYVGGGTGGLPGDALGAWTTGDLCTAYVVDLADLKGSWGTPLAVGPILKSSKASTSFFGSLISAQSMSRLQASGVSVAGTDYSLWTNQPGYGVNTATNTTPGTIAGPSVSNQFGVVFSEYATSDAGFDYGAVVGALVNYDPSEPNRLYVKRVQAVNNSCDGSADLAGLGIGTVDEYGNVLFRADDFGTIAGCGLSTVAGNNIYHVDLDARDCATLNVLSGTGQADAAAGNTIIAGNATVHSVPNVGPESIFGTPYYLGANFNSQFVKGPVVGPTSATTAHLGGASDQRGVIAYMSKNIACIGGTHGTGATLSKYPAGDTTGISIFGLDSAGNPVGATAFGLPATVTDNLTGVTNLGGASNEFDHYHSQAPYQGGNSQVALNVDTAGRLLAAAVVAMPDAASADNPLNYIAVARVNPDTCTEEWTMAAYNIDESGNPGTGKEIYAVDPNGVEFVMGQLVPLPDVTGGSPFGPSMSAPMIDAAGNVWFISSVYLTHFADGTLRQQPDPDSALIRAVYDPATFSYKLELVLELGTQILGENSGLEYMITFMSTADSNSVSSGTAWSQNIAETAFLGKDIRGATSWSPADPRSSGGVVVSVEVVYNVDGDSDGDGFAGGASDFIDPTGSGGDPLSPDEAYNVMLYIAPDVLCGDSNCDGIVDTYDIDAFVLALTTPSVYESTYGCPLESNDTNFDGIVDTYDIDAFVAALVDGVCP